MLKTSRVKVKRLPDRGVYDAPTIHSILDQGFVCHVGFSVDGQPYVIPTLYARDGNKLYLHGSHISRMLHALRERIDMCVTVTLVDGLVLARSGFNHSINYRSVVVLGQAHEVTEKTEKEAALTLLVEHVIPGRTQDARGPTVKELRATMVLVLSITEASAKVRTGPPHDTASDLDLDVWAGVIPLEQRALPPEPSPDLREGIAEPEYVRGYRPAQRPPESDDG